MSIMQAFLTYLMTVPVFFAIDMVWLGVLAKDFYARELGDLLTKNVIWWAAGLFYALFLFGILYFAILPAVDKQSLRVAVMNGALFGCIAYATYDLTNLATTAGWPTRLVFVDIVWGTVLSLSVAAAGYWMSQWVR